MANELKPCPFCGGKNLAFRYAWGSAVPLIHCSDCGALVSFTENKRDTFKYSTDAWNRRAPDVEKKPKRKIYCKHTDACMDGVYCKAGHGEGYGWCRYFPNDGPKCPFYEEETK